MARLVEDGGEASGGAASEDLNLDGSDSDVQVVSSSFVDRAEGSVLSPGGVIPTGEVSGPQGEEASRRLRHRRKVTPPATPGAVVTGGMSSLDEVQ